MLTLTTVAGMRNAPSYAFRLDSLQPRTACV
jgi:hypothetical protein